MKTFTAISAAAVLAGVSQACSEVGNSQVTFYGFPDNSPPSAQVAHNCGGRNYVAGGTGTYADPLTFATAPGEFSPCEIAYLPLLKKYIRYEDDCEQCESDWKGGKHHIDIWTGSNKDGGQKQIDCEDELTSGGQYTVLRQPGEGLEVNSSPLFDGSCHKENVFESNKASCDSASSGSGNSTTDGDDGSSGKGGKGGKGSSSSSASPSGFSTSATPAPTKTGGKGGESATATSAADQSQSTDSNDDGSQDGSDDGSQDGSDDGSQDGGDDGDDDEDCGDDDEE